MIKKKGEKRKVTGKLSDKKLKPKDKLKESFFECIRWFMIGLFVLAFSLILILLLEEIYTNWKNGLPFLKDVALEILELLGGIIAGFLLREKIIK